MKKSEDAVEGKDIRERKSGEERNENKGSRAMSALEGACSRREILTSAIDNGIWRVENNQRLTPKFI